jgi:hypothetical protein
VTEPAPRPRDLRRAIHAAVAGLFALGYALAAWGLVPSRQLLGAAHLWALPIAAATMAVGGTMGGRGG